MELLEKNLKNENPISPNEIKNPSIEKDNNNLKINLDIKTPSKERLLKQEKIKQNKEKAKEIEKNAHLNSTSNFNSKIKKSEKKITNNNINKNKSNNSKNTFNNANNINKNNDINNSKSNYDKKLIQINKSSNNNPIKINPKIQNKWSKAKFGTLDDNNSQDRIFKSPPGESKNTNTKKRATSLTKFNNKNIFRNKNTNPGYNIDDLNINKKNESDEILEFMNKEIKEREKYNKKLNEYNNELAKIEKEKEKLKKLKEEYENLNLNFQKEKEIYNLQKVEEKKNFDNFIQEEMKLINKEKKQLSIEQKNLNDLRVKYQMHNKLENRKGKNEVEQMKSKINEKQKEMNRKDNNDKILIEKYKKQLQEAYDQIDELNALINEYKEKNGQNQFITEKLKEINNNNDININYFSNEYDLVFLEKYHGLNYNLIKTEKTEDGKTCNFYDNNKREIIFKNGVRKEIFNDGYQVIYFNNGDIKQIFPGENKQVYFFKEKNIVQTTIGDECQIFKHGNGEIEKKFKDGTIQIISPDGKIKNILPNGYEEVYNINGNV